MCRNCNRHKSMKVIYLHCLLGTQTKASREDDLQRQLIAPAQWLAFDKAQFIVCFTSKWVSSGKKNKYLLAFWSAICKRHILILTSPRWQWPLLPSPFYKLLTKRQEDSNCAAANWPLWSLLNSPEKSIGFKIKAFLELQAEICSEFEQVSSLSAF